MYISDPYGPAYTYDGEEILIDVALTREQHAGCYEAVGVPAPPYDPDRQEHVSIEPATPGDAERLRSYLREQRIAHHSELAVTYAPDSAIEALLERLDRDPVFPGRLEEAAHSAVRSADTSQPTSARLAVEALYRCSGSEQTARQIEAAQRLEAETRELITLAGKLALAGDALDEAVHDSHLGDPSQINNEGLEAQIRHLLTYNTAETVRVLITQAAPMSVAARD